MIVKLVVGGEILNGNAGVRPLRIIRIIQVWEALVIERIEHVFLARVCDIDRLFEYRIQIPFQPPLTDIRQNPKAVNGRMVEVPLGDGRIGGGGRGIHADEID